MDTYCKGKWELVKGKGVRVKINRALIRGGKGKGHF